MNGSPAGVLNRTAPGFRSQLLADGDASRTMARSFSAALDEMFKLEGVGALELSLDKKCAAPLHSRTMLTLETGRMKSIPRNTN